jgi:hypothetical protein
MAIVASHHETQNGAGYPEGISADQIPQIVRIASIVNIYDNLCNRPDPATSLTPNQALSYMFGKQRQFFDEKLLSIFIRILGVYPPGSIVKLSNGGLGMVISSSTKSSVRPHILLYDPEIPKEAAIIFDMDDDPEISIAGTISPLKLKKEIYEYLSPRTRVVYAIEKKEFQRGA